MSPRRLTRYGFENNWKYESVTCRLMPSLRIVIGLVSWISGMRLEEGGEVGLRRSVEVSSATVRRYETTSVLLEFRTSPRRGQGASFGRE
jgi:hypothetical protein